MFAIEDMIFTDSREASQSLKWENTEKNDFLGSKLSQKQPQTYSFCKLISFFG